ncbi:MAG: type I-U CRISPR-associated helicase/endonuclease Cas3 [Candidatus Solibacter usitatus]|nr:type I-U CRISPR-associated helicase/endonuclease Cas3 [Candidatus Solibacter usitatus]
MRAALAKLCCAPSAEPPLAVSTLRGEFQDNREWSRNPSRPAIIIGTVDMIGSRLLFSGYGDSFRRRPSHAGLLGQDTLIVNDEAHLTPAFAALIRDIETRTSSERPLRTILLSATQRESSGDTFPKTLDSDLVSEESVFAKRYRAVKRLHVKAVEKPREEIRSLALQPGKRTIVFVRSPGEARSIATAIEKEYKDTEVILITGMQRGFERDQILKQPQIQPFLCKAAPAPDASPCWIVATSAGEVGIDLSADRLITDIDTADHLLQRFGRLNRFGETEGDAYVFYNAQLDVELEDDKNANLRATVKYLHSLEGNISPENLRRNRPRPEANTRGPNLAPILPWLIDVWSMTSIKAKDWPSRPAVEPWLRGDEEASPPETYVAWREDVLDLTDPEDIEEVLDCFPVVAQERLKQYSRELCNDLEKSPFTGNKAILIAANGEIFVDTLAELLKRHRSRFNFATLLLEPNTGHLDANGMVDWAKPPTEQARYDVSETPARKRIELQVDEERPETGLRFRYEVFRATDDEGDAGRKWVYFSGEVRKKPQAAAQFLDAHLGQVASMASDLAGHLGFDERLVRIFEWAGKHHDLGKDRRTWQRAARNFQAGPALAKSAWLDGRALGGYRHELGSLLDAENLVPAEFTQQERDLALHLVAAHHGFARPHFPDFAYDKTAVRRSAKIALESARRFSRLQRHYGAWGLAYLETIFRAADAIVSAASEGTASNA